MRIKIAHDDAPDLIPEGDHFAKIEFVEDYTGKSGKKSLRWTFIVPQGAMQKRIETYTSTESGKTWKLREFLGVLGFKNAQGGSIETGDIDFDPNDLLDVPVIVTITHEKFNKRTQERVESIVRKASSEDAPADPFGEC